MANTLKFGNSEWYGTEGNILAYNDENGNFKPLPFDFSRGSIATRVNQQGLIETVGANDARVDYLDNVNGALLLEPSRTNLITYSEDFANTYWTKSGASIQGDPSTAGAEQVTNGNFATNSSWTISGLVTIANGVASFIDNGTNGNSSITQNILTANKTYKITFDVTRYVAGNLQFVIGNTSNSYDISSGVGSYVVYYTVTSGDIFRMKRNGGYPNFNFDIDNVSVKEVQGFTSPDGTNNAFKLVEDTSTGIHQLTRSITNTVANQYSISVFVKENTRNWIRLSSGDGGYVFFNISDNTIGIQTNAVGVIEDIGNGWKRCKITFTAAGTNGSATLRIAESDGVVSYVGQNKSVYVYAMQYEQGSYATSIINTQGTAQTRLADSCSQTPPDGVIGQTEGTIFVSLNLGESTTDTNSSPIRFSLTNGVSSDNWIFIGNETGDNLRVYVRANASSSVDFIKNNVFPSSGNYKIAMSFKSNETKCYVNGVLQYNGSLGIIPNNLNSIGLGSGITGDAVLDKSQIKEYKLYNNALTDQELIALTQV